MKNIYIILLFLISGTSASSQANTSLTALYEKNKNAVKLRWQHNEEGVFSYTIQRSSDNTTYRDIYTKNAIGIEAGDFLKFTDDKLSTGKNYYRLMVNRSNYSSVVFQPVLVIPGNYENKWVVFPVPVGPVLNLQYAGSDALQGVITVVIQSVTSGTIFTKLRLASTNRAIQIPVSNIGKGLYDLRIYVGNDVVWNRRFVK